MLSPNKKKNIILHPSQDMILSDSKYLKYDSKW